jgi:hypothetical protein
MNINDFRDVGRLLTLIDMQDLVRTGAMSPGDLPTWNAFRADPLRFLLRTDDLKAHCIWEAMMRCKQRHQTPTEVGDEDAKVVELRTAARFK